MEESDSIAIVGIACRFPGADDIDEFWELLKNGDDHVKTIPKERWDIETIHIQKLDDEWKPEAMWAGLVKDHDKFDNKFFGISDSEAGWMDPHQCMALEVTYSALENAGLTREMLKGTNTGVYVGLMNRDLSLGLTDAAAEYNNFLVTGNASSIVSNLISYHFDIRGPSMTVDTACSSALVSIHLGCQAIKSGDCSMAICGGVNSILTPIYNIVLSKAQMISKTGKSRAFSADADGYVRGEGCGMVVLKPLKKARADGNRIWGIVMSGCNQDGKASTPITAPSGQQQKTLLQNIYSDFNISPSTIQYIEAHGTGTPVGDPIEMNALAEFFQSKLECNIKIPIGSVKTNIGHLESSAGTAGLIKVLLMMKYEKIVPSLHYSKGKGNTKIDFEKNPLEVSTELCDWKPHNDGTRFACVNSFGFGGTNSHAVIKQLAPEQRLAIIEPNNHVDFLITLSAPTQEALKSTARHFKNKINTEMYDIRDLSYTSVRKREHYRYRIALVSKTISDLKTQLSDTIDNFQLSLKREMKKPRLIFFFSGVGTLWLKMCQKLMNTCPLFKTTVEEINNEIQKHGNITILETLKNPPPNFITDSFLGPIAIFTCQIGLFKRWQSLGVSPDVIIGQSVGEVAAAFAAGCLTLPEAVKVIYYRSLFSSKAPSGGMVVVGKCNVDKLEGICKSYGKKLNVAVYSSKETCIVSGNESAIESLKKNLSNNPEFPSVLLSDVKVTCAYHSHYMKEASEKLENKMRDLKGRAPTMKIISTVSGKEVNGPEMGTAEYWSSNLRKPVLLVEAVSSAIGKDMTNIFLEIGPKPVIHAHLKSITDAAAESIPSCNSPDDGIAFVKAVAALYVHGIEVNIEQMSPSNRNLTDIPRHKFYRSGTLLASETVRASLKLAKSSRENHPFIFARPLSDQFNVTLSIENTPYLYEHMLDQVYIVPGALHAEIGLTVSKVLSSSPLSEISVSLKFLKPVFVGRRQTVELDVFFSKQVGSFEIKRKQDVVCKGNYFSAKIEYPVVVDICRIKKMCPSHVSQQLFYKTLHDLGFEYGKILTVIRNSWTSDTEYISELEVPSEIVENMYTVNLHPCILDGVLQTSSVPWISAKTIRHDILMDFSRPIPVKLGALSVKRIPKRRMYVYGKMMTYTIDRAFINLLLLSENGEVIAEIENYEVKNVSTGRSTSSLVDISYKTRWLPVEGDYSIGPTLHKSEKSMFICLSEDTYGQCKKKFKSTSSAIIRVDVPFTGNFEYGKIAEQLFKDIESQNLKVNEFEHIIYLPGYDHSSEAPDNEEVYNCIKASCICLLKLLQRLFEESIEIPIIVVTKNTQPHVGSSKQMYNITGSELWGMCRSIVRERAYSNIKLLDISDDNDLQMITVIIHNSKANDFWKYTPEFKCYGNTLYCNQVVRFDDDNVDFRMNHYNKNEALDLRSSNYKNLENMFFIPKPTLQTDLRYCSLKVETVMVNPELSPLTATIAVDDPDPWKAIRVDGHGIIATEICGKMESFELQQKQSVSSVRSRNELQDEDINQQANTSYLTCFPCNASNIVQVPVSCLISKDEFPKYKPGILHQSIWYFSLLLELHERQPLGIIYDKELSFNLELLQSILESKRHESVFFYSVDELRENFHISGKNQFLFLTKHLSTIKDCFSKIASFSSRIITYSQLITKAEERVMRQQLPGIDICIINNDDILSENRLSKLMALLRSWLAKKPCMKLGDVTEETKIETLINFNDEFSSDKMINCQDFPVKTDKRYLFSKSAGYMIIGGLTGLGWETVELIAKMGGGCVAILSRQQPSKERQKEMNTLSKKYNCKIISLQADVSEIESTTKAFEAYQRECQGFQLKGIFHGAAVVDDAIFLYMTEEKFEKVLKPKIKGTLNLHSLTKDMKLDYFVLHSSITSVFGNAGQSNYGAGNAFMDTFAYYRRSLGFSGQTINWGALHLGILTASENIEKHLYSQGYTSLKPTEVMECLLHSLCSDLPQIFYGHFQWETIVRQSLDMLSFAAKLQPILMELNLIDAITPKHDKKIMVDVEELRTLPENKLQKKISDVLVLIAADIFAVEESLVKTETKFPQFGVDSMKAMALINTIFEHLRCKISVMSILNEDANIESITTLIMQQMTLSNNMPGILPSNKVITLQNHSNIARFNLSDIERAICFFENNSSNFSYIQADIDINDCNIDELTIRTCFTDLCSIYPEMESVYVEENGIYYRTVQRHQKEDAKTARNYLETVAHFRDAPITNTGDILPLSHFVIYEGRVVKVICLKKENILRIRLLCDRILFDQTSTTKLSLDFISIIKGNSLQENKESIDSTDIALKNVPIKAMETAKSFWSRHVSLNVIPIALNPNPQRCNDQDSVKILCSYIEMDQNNNLEHFLVKNNLSRFEFFTTVFQIFLHFISGNDVVSVSSFVDTRRFLLPPTSIGSMENLLPYIAIFRDKEMTCLEFLLKNVLNLREANEHCIVPVNIIEKMFINKSAIDNAFMYAIFTDKNTSDFGRDIEHVRLTAVKCFDSRFHISLHISEDINHTELSLHFRTNVVDETTARFVLESFSIIAAAILNNDGATMMQLEKDFKATDSKLLPTHANIISGQRKDIIHEGDRNLHKTETVKFRGSFLQETTNGQDHMVDICVIETSSKTIILQWDTNEKEETVDMSSVMDTKSYFLNGMKVVMLQTHGRQYILKTTDHRAFDVFMTFIS